MRSIFVYILAITFLPGNYALAESASARARDRSIKTDTGPKKSRKRRTDKLLEWVGLDWIDINLGKNSTGGVEGKDTQDLKDLMGKLANARGKNGTGNGKGNGSGASLKFNDNAPKGGSAGDQDKEGVGDRGGQPPGGGGNGPPDESKVFPLYWPVCMFFDPAVDNGTGNSIVKGSVDMAAACGVNLFVVPITVKSNYSDNPDEYNPRQQKSCNMQSIGISTASTLLVNKWPLAAAKMCQDKPETNGIQGLQDSDYDPGIAGCAQVRSGGGMSKKNLSMGSSGGMASGGIIPSTIVPNGWNAGVASHEFLGHSQMGWDNYVNPAKQIDAGLGIGSPEKQDSAMRRGKEDPFSILVEDEKPHSLASEGDTKGGSGWTGAGCAQMRQMALPNTKKISWNPKQTAYYQRQEDPAAQWNLGEPLWGPTPPSAPPTQQPPLVDNRRPEPPAEDEKLVVNEDAKKGSPTNSELDGRHKKNKGGGDVEDIQKLFTSLRKRGQVSEENEVAGKAPGGGLDKTNGSSLTFDENAKKADGTTPSGDGAGGKSGAGGSGDGNSLTFDENAAKGGAGSGEGASRDLASNKNGIGSGGKGQVVKGQAGTIDEDFFGPIIKAERRKNRRVKGATLREKLKERGTTARGRPVEGN